MERFQIPLRILATAILVLGVSSLSRHLAEKVALHTSPPVTQSTLQLVQGRRVVLDRLAHAISLIETDPDRAETALLRIVQDARDPVMRTAGSRHLKHLARTTWPDDHRRAFLMQLMVQALESARSHGVPPSIILGQAALESGWGRSALAVRHHNLFGVKSTGPDSGADYPTLEFGPRGVHIVRAQFRTFETVTEAVEHHGRLLAKDPRYSKAMSQNHDWQAFLIELAPSYASDPEYVNHVSRIIRKYSLDRWDAVTAAAPPHS